MSRKAVLLLDAISWDPDRRFTCFSNDRWRSCGEIDFHLRGWRNTAVGDVDGWATSFVHFSSTLLALPCSLHSRRCDNTQGLPDVPSHTHRPSSPSEPRQTLLHPGHLQCSLTFPSSPSSVPIITSGPRPRAPSTHSTKANSALCDESLRAVPKALGPRCPKWDAPGPPVQWDMPGMRKRR